MNEKQSEKEKISLADVIGIFVMLIMSMLFAIAVAFAIGLPTVYIYYILAGMPKHPTTAYNIVLFLSIMIPLTISLVWFTDRLSRKGLDRKISRKLSRRSEKDEQ